MKRELRSVLLQGVIVILALGVNTDAIAQTGERTREDLKSITDKFYTALEAHNTFGVHLSAKYHKKANSCSLNSP